MYILGVDLSTTTTGYTFLDKETGEIMEMGFIDSSKLDTINSKANYVTKFLFNDHKFSDEICLVVIEDSLSGFSSGRTMQQVLIKLSKINAVFCFISEYVYIHETVSVNASSARKLVFGSARREGVKSKDFVKEMVESNFDVTPWLVYTRINTFDKRNIDAYDSLVCAKYGYINERNKNRPVEITGT